MGVRVNLSVGVTLLFESCLAPCAAPCAAADDDDEYGDDEDDNEADYEGADVSTALPC